MAAGVRLTRGLKVSISDYLDKMVVTALSPDRNIRARISDYTNVELGFRPNVYDRYSESDLSHQLARLGLLTWVSYHRGRTEAYQKSQGLSADELAEAEKPSPDGRRQRYEKTLNEITGVGVSAGRVVRIRTTGMMQWEVDLKPGALRQLTEDRFLAEAQS
ncbi:MAG: hypothetical protein JXA67_02320, partial [Micromonosporaceae bacterium]|nr:hypothetical protein [Micromonosporaceae bacterium]